MKLETKRKKGGKKALFKFKRWRKMLVARKLLYGKKETRGDKMKRTMLKGRSKRKMRSKFNNNNMKRTCNQEAPNEILVGVTSIISY